MKPDLSVVIPAHNEIEAIPSLFAAIEKFVAAIDFLIQFVFVDDGSTDGTYEELCAKSIHKAEVKIIKLSKNFGAHAAIRAGIYHADADYTVIYSMDMPEPIEDIARFYAELLSGTEIVYSKRLGYRGSLGSRIFARLVYRLIMPSYPTEGLIGVAFGPKAKAQLNQNMEANTSLYFQIFQLGFSTNSFDVIYQERETGVSSWTFTKKLKLMIDCFVTFSFLPIRAISTIGVIMAALGFIWAIVIVIIKVFGLFELSAGWPTLLSVILIGFGITNLSLGIISEYLVRIMQSARNTPVFIVDRITEHPSGINLPQ